MPTYIEGLGIIQAEDVSEKFGWPCKQFGILMDSLVKAEEG